MISWQLPEKTFDLPVPDSERQSLYPAVITLISPSSFLSALLHVTLKTERGFSTEKIVVNCIPFCYQD